MKVAVSPLGPEIGLNVRPCLGPEETTDPILPHDILGQSPGSDPGGLLAFQAVGLTHGLRV